MLVFILEDGNIMFVLNVGVLPTSSHIFTTHKANNDVFTVARNSNLGQIFTEARRLPVSSYKDAIFKNIRKTV
jgi:hypothetical protein